MKIKNFEFKARVSSLEDYENLLLELNPVDLGTEHQVDTYFKAPRGRLKLREIKGKDSRLIDYEREDISESKKSDILLYHHPHDETLKKILSRQLGIYVVVDKKRKIYGIENVRFHFDVVKGLGCFLEVEAIDEAGLLSMDRLKEQCDFYYNYLGIQSCQVERFSYSDLLLQELREKC